MMRYILATALLIFAAQAASALEQIKLYCYSKSSADGMLVKFETRKIDTAYKLQMIIKPHPERGTPQTTLDIVYQNEDLLMGEARIMPLFPMHIVVLWNRVEKLTFTTVNWIKGATDPIVETKHFECTQDMWPTDINEAE